MSLMTLVFRRKKSNTTPFVTRVEAPEVAVKVPAEPLTIGNDNFRIDMPERSSRYVFGPKLTVFQVKEIKRKLRTAFPDAPVTAIDAELAAQYNVSPSTIRNIRRGETWKGVTI